MFYNDVLYLHLSFTGTIHLNIIYLFIISASILSVRVRLGLGFIGSILRSYIGPAFFFNVFIYFFKCTE